jgi:hypothetical protein
MANGNCLASILNTGGSIGKRILFWVKSSILKVADMITSFNGWNRLLLLLLMFVVVSSTTDNDDFVFLLLVLLLVVVLLQFVLLIKGAILDKSPIKIKVQLKYLY